MGYLKVLNYIKLSLTRGYAFFGLIALCWITIIILVIVYGHVGSYEVDPHNPNVMRNDRHEMQRDTFDRYYLISKTLATICFWGGIVAVILYGYWKKWSFL